ncbi:MAG: hypothetical protein E6J85_05590 [Deltaproteobacteria bacterium]|nr:MAG: hypothetical protein E6J85_05590 [Deltaproteobacteria bacterium]TMB31409.1 MAG: hypothetical protein E6J61_10230 [Deltaproteobacteria bacterium]
MTPRAQVEAFLREQPGLFAAVPDDDGSGLQLFEAATGKSLAVRWSDLADAVVRRTSLRPAPYLVLVFHDGRQVALADVGFAFAPSVASTGPLPDLPQTFCFRDFRHLSQGIESLLEEEGREREALSAVLLAIALLDGAKVAGFEVGREERALEALLRKLEERGIRV